MWYTWFDRDLTVAGRVLVREKKGDTVSYAHKLVRVQEPIMRIPSLAIHLNRTISTDGFKINNQDHLVPVLGTLVKNEMQTLVKKMLHRSQLGPKMQSTIHYYCS